MFRMETCSRHKQRNLSNTNSNTINTKISQAQDPAAVSHNNDLDVVAGPVTEDFSEAASVLAGREVHAQGGGENVMELLTCLPHLDIFYRQGKTGTN